MFLLDAILYSSDVSDMLLGGLKSWSDAHRLLRSIAEKCQVVFVTSLTETFAKAGRQFVAQVSSRRVDQVFASLCIKFLVEESL